MLSTKSHADIVSVDATAALAVDGVFGFLCARDIPGDRNKYNIGAVMDEEVFASEKARVVEASFRPFRGAHGEFILQVRAVGQPVAAVVAKDQDTAQRAAKLVRVEYRALPAVVTIEEAIEAGSFYPATVPEIMHGDAAAAMESAPHVISGSVRSGAQEHFYLETNAVVAVPNKEKVMER